MDHEDKTLTCQDCGQPLDLSGDDKPLRAMMGFTDEAKHCTSCREARRNERKCSYAQSLRDTHPWYAPIVVTTPPPRYNRASSPQAVPPIASANGSQPYGQAGTGQ